MKILVQIMKWKKKEEQYYNYQQCVNVWVVKLDIEAVIFSLIIWQGSLEVNPSLWLALSWSGFCLPDHFHRDGHKPCIFWFSKAGKSKFAAKTSAI